MAPHMFYLFLWHGRRRHLPHCKKMHGKIQPPRLQRRREEGKQVAPKQPAKEGQQVRRQQQQTKKLEGRHPGRWRETPRPEAAPSHVTDCTDKHNVASQLATTCKPLSAPALADCMARPPTTSTGIEGTGTVVGALAHAPPLGSGLDHPGGTDAPYGMVLATADCFTNNQGSPTPPHAYVTGNQLSHAMRSNTADRHSPEWSTPLRATLTRSTLDPLNPVGTSDTQLTDIQSTRWSSPTLDPPTDDGHTGGRHMTCGLQGAQPPPWRSGSLIPTGTSSCSRGPVKHQDCPADYTTGRSGSIISTATRHSTANATRLHPQLDDMEAVPAVGEHSQHGRSGSTNPTATTSERPTLPSPPRSGLPDYMARIQYPHPPEHTEAIAPQGDEAHLEDLLFIPWANAVKPDSPAPDYRRWPYPSLAMRSEAAQLYERALAARLAGSTPPPVHAYTTLDTQAWVAAATDHPQDEMVLQGIQQGFPIQYAGPPQFGVPASYNHAIATGHAPHVDDYIQKETACSALEGPFTEPPFTPWFYASPLMTREKGDGIGRRVIVDLSFPEGGINKHIPPHLFNGQEAIHRLPTIESAVATISTMCPGDIHLAVVDLSRAYRQFPVDPLDWPLLGIYWRNGWVFDRRLPFGSRASSYVMQMVADFIVRSLKRDHIASHMYLDNIIVISPTRQLAERHYNAVIQCLHRLGLQVAVKKLQPPSPSVRWLGIGIDVAANRLSIPDDKLAQIRTSMASASRHKSLTRKHLQRLVGLANHLAKVVRAARIFVCGLLAALRAATTDHIVVTRHVRSDLAWFVRYLQDANGRAIIPHRRVSMRIWADTCLVGGGASDGAKYYKYVFPRKLASVHHITQLEALNCVAAVRTFVDRSHAGGIVQVFCDNQPSVDALTSGRAKDPVLAACARALWLHAARTDTDLEFTHMPGEGMALPDALSRASFGEKSRKTADDLIYKLSLKNVGINAEVFSYGSFL